MNIENIMNCVFFPYSVQKHYRLAMHVFGLLASCASLPEMDDIVVSGETRNKRGRLQGDVKNHTIKFRLLFHDNRVTIQSYDDHA